MISLLYARRHREALFKCYLAMERFYFMPTSSPSEPHQTPSETWKQKERLLKILIAPQVA